VQCCSMSMVCVKTNCASELFTIVQKSVTGDLSKEYIRQCNDFLASMGMDEDGFRTLLKRGHKIMRKEAEAERNRLGL
jgi:hypothetical protein